MTGKSHRDMARALEDEIVLGSVFPGAVLLSEVELAKRFGVGRSTIQAMLRSIANSGLIERQGDQPQVVSTELPFKGTDQSVSEVLPFALKEAFQRSRVTIDFFGLTAETLYAAMRPVIEGLGAGDYPQTQKIEVRILLPDPRTTLTSPSNVDDPTDPRSNERLKKIGQVAAGQLVGELRKLPQM
jgi:DNA-binding transcriptional regulator YhcF (GntR family)